ncbi:MAG: restriction endonuclease subunit S [Fimbriimonadaceae bacterium]|nr:restriction endonuclease subunit S [Fimbriimonadaceae bacterium]
MAASLPHGTTAPRGLSPTEQIHWPLVASRDLFELKYGRALVESMRRPGSVPVYGTNGRCGSHDEALFEGPGVIIGRKGQGPLGVEWSEDDYWVIDTAYSLTPRRPDLDLRYAYFLIKHIGLNHLKDGTSNPTLSRDTFGAQALPLPPLDQQRCIAHILGTLDEKIELNRQMNETLEAMARALFKSWFVDFDPVRAKAEGRDPGLPKPLADLFPARLVDSELGEIPEGWEVGTLGELIDTIKGRSYKSEELVESDTALVTLKSFARGGGYRPDGLKSFAGTYKPEQVVQPGELVIACTDVTQAADVIGRPAIVRGTGTYRRLVASLDTLIVRPRDSSMARSFLYFLAGTETFVAHTYAHTTGTTVLHLAKEAVPSYRFALPSPRLVHQFDSLASPALGRVQALEEESDTIGALRNALLPKLISGELRVKDPGTFMERGAL